MPSDGVVSLVPWPPNDASAGAAPTNPLHLWTKGSASFQDLLDTLNPLQHLPVISTIYDWITGRHDIGDLPRIAGDALYGGPWGALSGLVNALVKEETGKDIGEQAVALLTGGKSAPAVAATPADPGAPAVILSEPSLATDPGNAAGSNTPAATAPTPKTGATTTAPPVAPDHPPLPLYRGAGSAAKPAGTNPMPVEDAASRAFLEQTAARTRELYRQRGTPTDGGRVLNPEPVPLMVPPGALPNGGRPRLQPTASPNAGTGGTPPAPGEPLDLSQKMLEALDKYMALQKPGEPRGGQVDVTP